MISMPDRTNPQLLMLQLKLKKFHQKRSLGQHFLLEDKILERISNACGLDQQTCVIEIGPGPGTLTTLLAQSAGHVVGIEYDHRLEEIHRDVFSGKDAVEFIYEDALRISLSSIAEREMAEKGFHSAVLAGNLPFQITSPLLYRQCRPDHPWKRIVVMVQKEVADRITSPHQCRQYGILTVKLACWWKITERFEVSSRSFHPPPKVDASVLVLEPQEAINTPKPADWPGLSAFIDAAFNQRRKKMVNSLSGRWLNYPGRDTFLEKLDSMQISRDVRAEALEPGTFYELYRNLLKRTD
jgi:16S rRNA (adenine1518-N6/adenine1519-N6)-dimethyltransferase